jgi:flagellar P-ring protein precursor FlgI
MAVLRMVLHEVLMKRNKIQHWIMVCIVGVCAAQAARIGDICDIYGVRGNPLMGTGIVVGLNGTGDSSIPSAQMLASLLRRESGTTFEPELLRSANIALVMVTAELGPWDREGSSIDINISSLGDAKSLQGGTLLATELKGLDGEVYAVARIGSISTSSWTVEGKTGSKASKNHPTVGRVPSGAVVERSELSEFVQMLGGKRCITLSLRQPSISTAERIRRMIDKTNPDMAMAQDPGTVRIFVPDEVAAGQEISFLFDTIMRKDVEVDVPAVVVINERTGTIVIGGNVTILETAVAQGSLVVRIKEQKMVSQPGAPFTEGATTQVVDDTALAVEEKEGALITLPRTVTVDELAGALNAIGASPRDLIAIFDALKKAGALQAKLEIM